MKLYVKTPAPSVLRVQIFVDECSRTLEEVEIADTRSPEFLAINQFGTVPVLQTDAGQIITESLTICRFLDCRWRSGLFGNAKTEHLHVELWERRAELLLYVPAIEYVHQTHPMFAGRIEQNPEWAKALAARAGTALAVFNAQLEDNRFMAGARFSIADITAFLGVSAFAALGAVDLSQFPALGRWAGEVGDRPSVQRLRTLTM